MQQLLIGQIIQICCDINADTKYEAMTMTTSKNIFICYAFDRIKRKFRKNHKIKLSFEIILNGDEETRKRLLDAVNKLSRFYREAKENEI